MAEQLEVDAKKIKMEAETETNTDTASVVQHEFSTPWENSDAVLVVGGQNLHVHKIILQMACPVFRKMFSQEEQGTHANEISLPDKNANEFVDFLRQIYPQFTKTLTFDNVHYIYALAEEFQLESIRSLCKTFVSSQQITRGNASKILQVAQQHKLEDVRQKCCQELQQFLLQDLEKFVSLEVLDPQSLRDIVVPRARRLEKCLQGITPKLFGLIDLVLYHSQQPSRKLLTCTSHHGTDDRGYVCAFSCQTSQQRLKCQGCWRVVDNLQWRKCSCHRSNEYCYKSAFESQNTNNIFEEMFELIKKPGTQ